MGLVIAKFRRKKDTYHILEDIDKNLKSLNQFNRVNQERRKKFIGRLVLYSIIIYIICAISLYFFFLPDDWHYRLYGCIPFLCFPIVVYSLKRILHWYFVRKITQNELQMQDLKAQRKDILENVMETETYKKAKEILEKFDPETKKKLEDEKKAKELAAATPQMQHNEAQLRMRNNTQRSAATPATQRMHQTQMPQGNGTPRMINSTPSLARPILPPTPSTMDKVLNYLVGDGVDQRYALICKNCYNHNGMAMKGEFEYLAFRCAYCRFFNPARKQRPNAPRLPDILPSPQPPKSSAPSSSDETSDSTPSTSRQRIGSAEGDKSEPKKLDFKTNDEDEIKVLNDSDANNKEKKEPEETSDEANVKEPLEEQTPEVNLMDVDY